MTQDEVAAIAKRVGFPIQHPEWQKAAEEFAALVEEKATEKSNAKANSSWTLMCEKMVVLEREACAKVADGFIGGDVIAERIRARGQA
jgi:hypothetical protein